MEFVYATYILERAEAAGVLVVNRPGSLRDANEKMFTAWFPRCCPPTLVTREHARMAAFLEEHRDVIVKPLDGMGGTSIFRVRTGDPNVNVVFETLTRRQTRYAMCQRYIPEIRDGDKRVLLIEGEPVEYALARVPAGGDARGNLAAGARGVGMEITARMRAIAGEGGTGAAREGPRVRRTRRDRGLAHRDQRHQSDLACARSTPRSGSTSPAGSWTPSRRGSRRASERPPAPRRRTPRRLERRRSSQLSQVLETGFQTTRTRLRQVRCSREVRASRRRLTCLVGLRRSLARSSTRRGATRGSFPHGHPHRVIARFARRLRRDAHRGTPALDSPSPSAGSHVRPPGSASIQPSSSRSGGWRQGDRRSIRCARRAGRGRPDRAPSRREHSAPALRCVRRRRRDRHPA